MFLGHSQQPTDHQKVPLFLLERLRPGLLLQSHGVRPVSLEPRHTAVSVRKRQAPAISLQEHPEFLRLLNDERFRQELKAKPAEVLARFGVHLASREVPSSVDLPSPPGKVYLAWTALF